MNLIQEIDAVSNERVVTQESYLRVVGAKNVRESVWWPRIKAALGELAAQRMDIQLTVDGHDNADQRQFRKAMDGEGK